MSILTPQQVRNFSDRLSSRADLFQEAFIDSVYSNLPQVFDAIVLSDNQPADSDGTKVQVGDSTYVILRIRPIGIHNLIYPDPFLPSCADISNKLINLHPQCVVEMPENTTIPSSGDVIECRLMKESNGQRSVILSTKIKTRVPGQRTVQQQRKAAQDAFLGQAPALVGNAAPAKKSTAQKSFKIYTLQEYKDFIPALKDFLDDIASHETGYKGPKSYNAYNCGEKTTCDSTVVQEFGDYRAGTGKLSTKTIAEIRASQNSRSANNKGVGVFAVGRYQLGGSFSVNSTQTFQNVIADLNINQNQVFGKEIQDVMGAYLILSNKQPTLHGYMVGKHDDAIAAAQAMAREWASYPSQFDLPDRNVKKGESYYQGVGNNAAAKGDSKYPEGVAERLAGWKTTFLNNAKVKQILGIT